MHVRKRWCMIVVINAFVHTSPFTLPLLQGWSVVSRDGTRASSEDGHQSRASDKCLWAAGRGCKRSRGTGGPSTPGEPIRTQSPKDCRLLGSTSLQHSHQHSTDWREAYHWAAEGRQRVWIRANLTWRLHWWAKPAGLRQIILTGGPAFVDRRLKIGDRVLEVRIVE